MQFPQTLLFLLTLFTTIHALALPAPFASLSDSASALLKRKGGGGGAGRGGGGSGGSSSSSSNSGGSRGGTSGGSTSSTGRTSPSSNVGGSTARGSGPLPAYGGSRYYAGGASQPYTAGSSRGGLGAPLLFAGAGLAVLPAAYLGGAYWAYGYPHYWYYTNRTSNRNESHPAQCMCQQYQSCGCDDNNSTDFTNDVANNASVAQLARINDTDTLVVNGSLPNGTTAPGGSDSSASGLKSGLMQMTGYWPLVAGVIYTMWFM